MATTALSSSTEILNAHNSYRQAITGVADLVWDAGLESDALQWATHIGNLGTLQHSTGTGQGENLWAGTSGAYTFTQMVDSWGSEKQYFKYGKFPDVSTTGNWWDVGHYTQIIWKNTQKVGCAGVNNGGWYWFVCRYSPPGNYVDQYPY